MDILILGGTQFVGRHIAEGFLHAGHKVTVFNRGVSPDPLPADVGRLHGDRDQGHAGIAALAGRTWDICVDVSGFTPQQVRPTAELLWGQVSRYIYISSRAVYAEPSPLPITEDAPLQAPCAEDVTDINGETYGPLKVACEQIVRETYGDACTILRPQIIVGPHDAETRYPYWLERGTRGGPVLVPGDSPAHLQLIDARDVARFVVRVAEKQISGTFNLAGERLPWPDFLQLIGSKDAHFVARQKVQPHLSQFRELSLYLPDNAPDAGRMNVSIARALAAGLTLTDPAVTARETLAWSRGAGLRYELTPEREAELMRVVNTP